MSQFKNSEISLFPRSEHSPVLHTNTREKREKLEWKAQWTWEHFHCVLVWLSDFFGSVSPKLTLSSQLFPISRRKTRENLRKRPEKRIETIHQQKCVRSTCGWNSVFFSYRKSSCVLIWKWHKWSVNSWALLNVNWLWQELCVGIHLCNEENFLEVNL